MSFDIENVCIFCTGTWIFASLASQRMADLVLDLNDIL